MAHEKNRKMKPQLFQSPFFRIQKVWCGCNKLSPEETTGGRGVDKHNGAYVSSAIIYKSCGFIFLRGLSFDIGRHQMMMHSRAMRACATAVNFFIFLDWVLGQSEKIKS